MEALKINTNFLKKIVYLAIVLGLFVVQLKITAAASCLAPGNSIEAENCLPGNPESEWDVAGAGDLAIQGYATDISVNRGETVSFKVKTSAPYRLDIYRLGFYGGNGARKVATVTSTVPRNQPACLTDAATGLVDCGNWLVSASWAVPANATSGVYIARAVRTDTGGASHIVFIVRNDLANSELLFQTSDTTWQAYNDYGGNSLYVGSPVGRAYKVSYNRPFNTRGNQFSRAFFFGAEYPMVRWLEANGYDVSYTTGVDTDRKGTGNFIGTGNTLKHKIFLSVGHDEYWSATQRTNVEAARNAGVNLAFFSGNEVFWKTRWEPSIDGSGKSHRTLVSYKETKANAKIDPLANVWTGTWRDPRFSPPADGGKPENALTGTIFTVNCCLDAQSIKVPEAFGKLRFWRNTSVATLLPGQEAVLPPGVLGYEWDEPLDNGFAPAGLVKLSSTSVNLSILYLLDFGNSYGAGTATHSLTLYRHSSGAQVFGAGTIRWSWGLDDFHDLDSSFPVANTIIPDVRMKQATVNLFADMSNVQPRSLQPGLVLASQSGDTVAPTSTITTPTPGQSVKKNTPIVVTGTANDSGGTVANVEISTDGGLTWRMATGRQNWSYTWTPSTLGFATIISRAVDDSGNRETVNSGVIVTVTPPSCPCTIWSSTATPTTASSSDRAAVEVGVKFRSDVAGSITGIRFYKGAANTGVHIGHLWSSTGQLLATATFTGETASGWQQVNFSAPVAVGANTVYVASYFAPNGGYAFSGGYFSAQGADNAPLHALQNGVSGGNGVYLYGATGGFPVNTFNSTNYWVDVVFNNTTTADTTPPTVTANTPSAGATNVSVGTTVTASFSEAMSAASITTGPAVELRNASNVLVPATLTYSSATNTATLTPASPLAANTLYTARVLGGSAGVKDLAGNAMVANFSWTFTTAGASSSASVTIWPSTATPATASASDTRAVELGVKFRSDVAGSITGIRFYKGAANTGVHIGHLWSSTGQLLATATFTGETASGWQQVNFTSPVAISANTVYVASYFAPVGRYAFSAAYFATQGNDNAPLHALQSGVSGGNGVYLYGATGGFPVNTFNSTNYWVDVVFTSP